ncbi:hypothetical protein C1H46_005463 [Malus baccata]|uniref:KIB1-4 beta-propeller domain-containing protein n=1 Tax=Malus baccata TaxID=106549 RepID=A0A540NEX9_MALBA|nr:hypothetical protein C1H46_005463 [Malus baccata]
MAVTYRRRIRSRQSAEWASLIGPALFSILDKVLEPLDHVHFAAVCKKWLAVAKDFAQRWCKALPMFMIPSETEGRRRLYSILEGKIYENIELPLPVSNNRKRCCGSGGDYSWLATVDLLVESRQTKTLLNPFNQAMAPIPIWSCLPTAVLSALNQDSYVVLDLR